MALHLIGSFMLFLIGVVGVIFCRKHLLITLICLELILLAADLSFAAFSVWNCDMLGQVYAIVVLANAAAESSIGLAILITYYRLRGGISVDLINLLKG